jgi:hypothetical protein
VKTHPLPRREAITVELAGGDRLADLDQDWRDLLGRADAPNVFMHPRLVSLAERAYPHRRNVALLAWHEAGEYRRLVGVWVFTVRRAPMTLLPMKVLTMPAMSHTAMPVIDRNLLDATLQAMLTRIAGDPMLPKLAALDGMADDSATVEALTRVLAERRSGRSVLARWARPKLASPLDGKAYFEQAMSSGSRKKLRQYRRRLSEKGQTRIQDSPRARSRARSA